jgi:hypothetical protein
MKRFCDSGYMHAGLLRVGAGFVLALGISLVSYLVYTKQGDSTLFFKMSYSCRRVTKGFAA